MSNDTHDGVDLALLRSALRRWDAREDCRSEGELMDAVRVLLAAHPVKVDPVEAVWDDLVDACNDAHRGLAKSPNPARWAARNRPDLLRALLAAAEAEEEKPWWQREDRPGFFTINGTARICMSHESADALLTVLDPAKERK